MTTAWLDILKREVENKGTATVARELGLSSTTISLVIRDQYGASTAKVQDRVQRFYSNNGQVACPVLGGITPGQCVGTWERAKKVGTRAGNPATKRLHLACRKCDIRNN